MTTNYPTTLDDDTSLHQVVDGVTQLIAAHHNNPKDAIKAIEAKVGIYNTSSPTALDYRLGHPTGGHNHNGASGQGAPLDLSGADFTDALGLPVAAVMHRAGSMIATTNYAAPLIFPKSMQIIGVAGALRRGPSGATTAFDINIGATSIWYASQGLRPIFAPGATAYRMATLPNTLTYPSGAVMTMDVDAVGSSDPGQEVNITFFFRT
jgi:hypothetical protein